MGAKNKYYYQNLFTYTHYQLTSIYLLLIKIMIPYIFRGFSTILELGMCVICNVFYNRNFLQERKHYWIALLLMPKNM